MVRTVLVHQTNFTDISTRGNRNGFVYYTEGIGLLLASCMCIANIIYIHIIAYR